MHRFHPQQARGHRGRAQAPPVFAWPWSMIEDFGRRSVFAVPFGGRGEEIAVAVAANTSARTITGKTPGLCRLLCLRSMAPSASSSFNMRFSAILASPLMLKARAISRLPILPRLAAQGFALAGDKGDECLPARWEASTPALPAVRGFGNVLPDFLAPRRSWSRLFGPFRFGAASLGGFALPALRGGVSPVAVSWRALVFGRPLFWAVGARSGRFLARLRVRSPRSSLSSIRRIASSSVDRLGRQTFFKVALVLP